MSVSQGLYDLLGPESAHQGWEALDLSSQNLKRHNVDAHDNAALSRYIFNGNIRYGGYGERRDIYSRSENYSEAENERNIHLGVDVWAPADTPIYAPWSGTLVVSHLNAGDADYGPTLIIKHRVGKEIILALYGHLSISSLSIHPVGTEIEKGALIAYLGNERENGGWPPHLHFQLIRELDSDAVDYPGVCSAKDWDYYAKNCPDPMSYLPLEG
ncbi:MAG: peptidoglycan DD-metalloendopeptidase family protein [Flavobacteriales bacterium]|nr:peptidoglycan DD-metalloendopeptidase family protein [Flavobacteriales bacterium]